MKPKEELTEEMIEKYDTKFITSIYEKREADIVYKLKGKEVFFLIEHQTKVLEIYSYIGRRNIKILHFYIKSGII